MTDTLREMVAKEIHAMTGSIPTLNRCDEIADRIFSLLSPYIAEEKRAAFVACAKWIDEGRGGDAVAMANGGATTEADRRYPKA
jgi:hypothetical protein